MCALEIYACMLMYSGYMNASFITDTHTRKKDKKKNPPKHLQKIISPWRLERQERHRNRIAFLAESENTAREERHARYLECGV